MILFGICFVKSKIPGLLEIDEGIETTVYCKPYAIGCVILSKDMLKLFSPKSVIVTYLTPNRVNPLICLRIKFINQFRNTVITFFCNSAVLKKDIIYT